MPRREAAWPRERVARHLDATVVPLRLGTVSSAGWPSVVSLWFCWREDALWLVMHRGARTLTRLRHDPRCAFEIARETPPYVGVRGQGRAELVPARGAEILEVLLARYGHADAPLARWLRARAADEIAVRIVPERLTGWDYRDRMGGA